MDAAEVALKFIWEFNCRRKHWPAGIGLRSAGQAGKTLGERYSSASRGAAAVSTRNTTALSENARLRQFDDPVNVARLVNLPETIVRRVLAESLTYNGAIRAQSAPASFIRSGGAAAREKSGRPRAGTGISLRKLARVPTPPFTWSSPPTRSKPGSALEFELPDAVRQAARFTSRGIARCRRPSHRPSCFRPGRAGQSRRDSLLVYLESARSKQELGVS